MQTLLAVADEHSCLCQCLVEAGAHQEVIFRAVARLHLAIHAVVEREDESARIAEGGGVDGSPHPLWLLSESVRPPNRRPTELFRRCHYILTQKAAARIPARVSCSI